MIRVARVRRGRSERVERATRLDLGRHLSALRRTDTFTALHCSAKQRTAAPTSSSSPTNLRRLGAVKSVRKIRRSCLGSLVVRESEEVTTRMRLASEFDAAHWSLANVR